MSFRLAVFDCDGTLVDGQAEICAAMDRAFAGSGIAAPDPHAVRRSVGLSLPNAVAQLLPEAGRSMRSDIVEAYKHAFRDAREAGALAQPLFPGIADTLRSLRAAGWELAIATGMSDRGLAHVLAVNDIADLFVSLQTADRHPSKPHPAMLIAALAEADADPADAVMIGDTQYDILMAREAGVRAIGVNWGYHEPEELVAAGAEFVADTPEALRAHLLA